MGEISMQRYFLNHINSFSLVKFYENYEFETQQDGEYAIKGVLDALRKKRDRNGKSSSRLGELIEMIEKNDYEYLNSTAARVFWSNIDVTNMLLLKAQTQIILKSEQEIKVLQKTLDKNRNG